MNVSRGDVVLIDYPFAVGPGQKVRPVLVIQNDRDNLRMATTIIAQITGNTLRASHEHTQLLIDVTTPDGQKSGLLKTSAVNCANLFTVDRGDVLRKLGALSAGLMQQIDNCLKAALSIP